MIYQIIILAFVVLDLGFVIAKHGQSRGEYNFWTWAIAECINLWILYKGGFFNDLLALL